MVLDRPGATGPACGQGTLVEFRARLIRNDMDFRSLERNGGQNRRLEVFLNNAGHRCPAIGARGLSELSPGDGRR